MPGVLRHGMHSFHQRKHNALVGRRTFSEVARTCAAFPAAHASAQPIATLVERLGPR